MWKQTINACRAPILALPADEAYAEEHLLKEFYSAFLPVELFFFAE